MPEREDTRSVARQVYLDVLGLAGIGVASYGAYLHYPPLAFMVGGGLAVAITIIGTLRS